MKPARRQKKSPLHVTKKSRLGAPCLVGLACLIAFLAANGLASLVLSAFPGVLKSEAHILNDQFDRMRHDHERFGSDYLAWYGAKSIDDVLTLWNEFASVPARYAPYTQFEVRPFSGRFYTVTQAGYRENWVNGPWPPSRDNLTIFFFGGSTAQGQTSNETTIASFLQDVLQHRLGDGRRVYVYNFGRSSYQSTQEKILFQELLIHGYIPDVAVFLDGLNDFCFADGKPSGWGTLQALYDRYHEDYLRRVRGLGAGADWGRGLDFLASLPLVRLAHAIGTHIQVRRPKYNLPSPDRSPGAFADPAPPVDSLLVAIDRYRENVRQIRALADVYGVTPFFVWQPIPTYKYDLAFHAFLPDRLYCHTNSRFGYPIMAKQVSIKRPDENFVWAADIQENAKENLYVDAVHYTAPFSERIAFAIAGWIYDHIKPRQ